MKKERERFYATIANMRNELSDLVSDASYAFDNLEAAPSAIHNSTMNAIFLDDILKYRDKFIKPTQHTKWIVLSELYEWLQEKQHQWCNTLECHCFKL